MLKRLALAGIILGLSVFSALAFYQSRDSNYNRSIAPSGAMTTPVLASFNGPSSGVANFIGPPVGAFNGGVLTSASATIRFVPIPMAGTIKNLYATLTGANASAMVNDVLGPSPSPVGGTVICSFSAAIFCSDSTHSDHLAAGTLLEWAENSGGGTWTGSPNIITISWDYLGDVAQQSMMLSNVVGITGTVTAIWSGFGVSSPVSAGGTEVDVSSIMPAPGQVTGFYVWANANETTAAHVYTVYHNGSAMGTVTCTPALSTAGCCVNTDASPGTVNGSIACATITCTTACHFNAGDTLSWEAACAAANCATVSPGASVRFTPDVANQAFLLAQNQASMPTGHFMGLEDLNNAGSSANFQTAPVGGMTLSKLIACNTSLTGSGSATFATKLATTPATAPTTAAGPSATVSSSTLCPGSSVAGLTNGFQDTSSVAVGGGYSLVNTYTIAGSPTITSFWKTGMVATVP